MTRHLRETAPEAFYAAIGVNRLGGERLPNSRVKTATTIYLDKDGVEVGRVERCFYDDPVKGQPICYLPGRLSDDEDLPRHIWL